MKGRQALSVTSFMDKPKEFLIQLASDLFVIQMM